MLEAIVQSQCKDNRVDHLIEELSQCTKEIFKRSNIVPAIFCWYKRFPYEWEIDQIDQFDDLVEKTISLEEELRALTGAPVNALVSLQLKGEKVRVQRIGFELFLYIKKRYPLQALLNERTLSSFQKDISVDSKVFLKKRRYGILYLLQYERWFENWDSEIFPNNITTREQELEDRKRHLETVDHLAPRLKTPEKVLKLIKSIKEDIRSGKHTMNDIIKMHEREIFYIYDDKCNYLKELRDMALVNRKDFNHVEFIYHDDILGRIEREDYFALLWAVTHLEDCPWAMTYDYRIRNLEKDFENFQQITNGIFRKK